MALQEIHITVGDLIVWADGEWAERDEYFRHPYDYSHKSDDFIVIGEGTLEWFNFAKKHELYTVISTGE